MKVVIGQAWAAILALAVIVELFSFVSFPILDSTVLEKEPSMPDPVHGKIYEWRNHRPIYLNKTEAILLNIQLKMFWGPLPIIVIAGIAQNAKRRRAKTPSSSRP